MPVRQNSERERARFRHQADRPVEEEQGSVPRGIYRISQSGARDIDRRRSAAAVQEWIKQRGFATFCIAPGSPWKNPIVRAFRAGCATSSLTRKALPASLLEAKVLAKEFRHEDNHHPPHSALDYQTPKSSPSAGWRRLPLHPAASQRATIPSTANRKLNRISHDGWIKLRGQAASPRNRRSPLIAHKIVRLCLPHRLKN